MAEQDHEPMEAVDHFPEATGYSLLAQELYGHNCPFMICSCGYETQPGLRWWESVGEDFDSHLAAIKRSRLRQK